MCTLTTFYKFQILAKEHIYCLTEIKDSRLILAKSQPFILLWHRLAQPAVKSSTGF